MYQGKGIKSDMQRKLLGNLPRGQPYRTQLLTPRRATISPESTLSSPPNPVLALCCSRRRPVPLPCPRTGWASRGGGRRP